MISFLINQPCHGDFADTKHVWCRPAHIYNPVQALNLAALTVPGRATLDAFRSGLDAQGRLFVGTSCRVPSTPLKAVESTR
jgi:hypothetical protein